MPIPPLAVAIAWIGVILGVTAAFFFAVRRWAGKTARDRPTANQLLTNFRELRASGDLTDDEYRSIKATLAPALAAEAEGLASAEAVAEAAAELRRHAKSRLAGGGPAGEASNDGATDRETGADDSANDDTGDDCAGPPRDGGDDPASDR